MTSKVAWVEDQPDKNFEFALSLERVGIELLLFGAYDQAKSFFERGGHVDGMIFDLLIPYEASESESSQPDRGLNLMRELTTKFVHPSKCFILSVLQDQEIRLALGKIGIPMSHVFSKDVDSEQFAVMVKGAMQEQEEQ